MIKTSDKNIDIIFQQGVDFISLGGFGMSKLNIDQQTIKELFSNKKSDFLIPDYQIFLATV